MNGKMTQKLGLGFGFTKKACFVCGSYSHLIKDCDFHEKRMANKSVLKDMGKDTGHKEVRPVWNNAQKINHQNKFVLSAVLTKFGRVPVSAAKQISLRAAASTSAVKPVNTITKRNQVNVSKSRTNTFHKSHSPIRRPFYKSTAPNTRISNEKVNAVRVNGVNTAGQAAVSAVEGKGVTAVKASAGCVWRPKVTNLNHVSKDNSGSWISKRVNYIDPQGRLKHMTGNKDFLTDYQDIDGGFVAFGGGTRGGKITGKGKIRTYKLDFEDVFFVKELNFNLFSVSQMCDKKNNVLFTETECLVLSPDFKLLDENQVLLRVPRQRNMYSFDLRNVVPSGDLTCLFAKAIINESKLWHKRLGHVNFKTINKLVKGNIVRGLPLKIFENDHTCVACQKGNNTKLPVRTSLEMNEFCDQKGIKREFRVARTSKQNRVAKRNNRTLIEATRTMLADLLLPTIFWAEAVNTACYVLNRVLVTKPHNKTPYELIIGRPSSISFMILFRCPVIILNTLDPLGKFDGKADEGFLVRYSVNSKAPRVFNTETRKVEENLHVNFLENEPNVAGQGPNWLFDIDSLTNSINYQPVTAGNQTDKNEGPQETNCDTGLKKNVDAGQSEEENSSDEKDKDDTADDAAGKKIVQEPASENEQALQNVLDKMMDQEKEATVQSDVVRKEFEAQFNAASASRTFGDAGPSFVPLEADFNNMEPSTVVSPIPTTRVHTIHPKGQIIGDPKYGYVENHKKTVKTGKHGQDNHKSTKRSQRIKAEAKNVKPHLKCFPSEDHVPVYIPEPEHPEDLVPAEDEAPTPLLPPLFLSPRIRPLSPRALEVEMREVFAAAACETSSGPTYDPRVDYSHVDTMVTREFGVSHHDISMRQTDHAAVRVRLQSASVRLCDDLAVQSYYAYRPGRAGARVEKLEDTRVAAALAEARSTCQATIALRESCRTQLVVEIMSLCLALAIARSCQVKICDLHSAKLQLLHGECHVKTLLLKLLMPCMGNTEENEWGGTFDKYARGVRSRKIETGLESYKSWAKMWCLSVDDFSNSFDVFQVVPEEIDKD
ncbi:ribonuclease H-like domain-containing protein [Tanacetum coccineum]